MFERRELAFQGCQASEIGIRRVDPQWPDQTSRCEAQFGFPSLRDEIRQQKDQCGFSLSGGNFPRPLDLVTRICSTSLSNGPELEDFLQTLEHGLTGVDDRQAQHPGVSRASFCSIEQNATFSVYDASCPRQVGLSHGPILPQEV